MARYIDLDWLIYELKHHAPVTYELLKDRIDDMPVIVTRDPELPFEPEEDDE